MSSTFSNWLHTDFFLNPSDYNVELGHWLDGNTKTITIVHKKHNNSFEYFCKIIYKLGEYATVGMQNGAYSELISVDNVLDVMVRIEDMYGMPLSELNDFYDHKCK